MLPFLALGLIVGFAFAAERVESMLVPVVALVGCVAALSWRVRWLRGIEQEASTVQELAVTRHHTTALSRAWRLLPRLRPMPDAHGRTIAAMAACLDRINAHDAAITAYDYLLERLPADVPGAVQLGVRRTLAQLMADRMTDADDALRRLRGVIGQYAGTPIAAGYRLAGLLQQVRTHHFADAVEESDGLVEALRPLGVDAGFGYALMALSHFNAGLDLAAPPESPAAEWWARATLLLSPAALVNRYGQLTQIAHLPATPRPEPPTSR